MYTLNSRLFFLFTVFFGNHTVQYVYNSIFCFVTQAMFASGEACLNSPTEQRLEPFNSQQLRIRDFYSRQDNPRNWGKLQHRQLSFRFLNSLKMLTLCQREKEKSRAPAVLSGARSWNNRGTSGGVFSGTVEPCGTTGTRAGRDQLMPQRLEEASLGVFEICKISSHRQNGKPW